MRCKNCNWENPVGRTKCEKCNAPLSGSMISPADDDEKKDNLQTVNDSDVTVCTCGYPLRPDESVCPNCGKKVSEMINNMDSEAIHNEIKDESHVESSPRKMSVNPWTKAKKKKTSKITLTPIPREDEGGLSPIPFEGNIILLNRDNTEKDNDTITTKEQAILIKEGDNWYIEDRSEFKTTMLLVQKKTQIGDGDVIALGDRLFLFNIK